jgi:hypothetical protein
MLKLKPKNGLCCILRHFSSKKEYQKKVDSFIEQQSKVLTYFLNISIVPIFFGLILLGGKRAFSGFCSKITLT